MTNSILRSNNYAEHGLKRQILSFCKATFHEETEIVRLSEGEGIIVIDGEQYALEADNLYIVRPFVLHTIKKIGREPLVIDYTKINLRKLFEDYPKTHEAVNFLRFFNEKNVPCVIDRGEIWLEKLQRNVDELIAGNTEKTTAQQHVYEMLQLLHEHRRENSPSTITLEKQRYAVQTALGYVSANFTKTISIKDVAQLISYDEYYAMKLFKRFCGWSIVDYANGLRINESAKLLEKTTDDICQIAKRVGYANVSYFNRQFKKIFGITPSEFRLQKI